jgi:hypothetical protein
MQNVNLHMSSFILCFQFFEINFQLLGQKLIWNIWGFYWLAVNEQLVFEPPIDKNM